jgi:Autotransporter beta-domain
VAASGDGASLELGGRLSLFVLGRGGILDKAHNEFEDGYDAALGGATLGGSYRILPHLVAGLGFDYGHEDGSYDRGGSFETDSYGVVAFGALTAGPLILQGSGGYAYRDYRRTRRVALIDENTGDVLPYGRSARGLRRQRLLRRGRAQRGLAMGRSHAHALDRARLVAGRLQWLRRGGR